MKKLASLLTINGLVPTYDNTHNLPTGIAVSSLAKSENLATAIGTYRYRLPVLIYSRPFVTSQTCEM